MKRQRDTALGFSHRKETLKSLYGQNQKEDYRKAALPFWNNRENQIFLYGAPGRD